MSPADPIDLEQLTRSLFDRVPSLEGYVIGRTSVRDAVVDIAGCSEERAEEIVELLQGEGFLRFEGNPAKLSDRPERWVLEPSPPAAH